MTGWRVGLASLATVALLGGAVAINLAASPPPPDPVGSPGSPAQSLLDGCQRNPPALLTRNSPEWVYVYNANTTASDPAPPPQWVTGTVSSFNPKFAAVHTSGGDLPPGHNAYDYNVNILPDPAYQFLLGGDPVHRTGNYSGNGEDTGRIHTEWEDLSAMKFAWAEPGDRLMEKGSWVWDCGHWGTPTEIFPPGNDYILPDIGIGNLNTRCLTGLDPAQCKGVTGEATEFHPYRALWDVRNQASASPYGENQAELFVSTDKTPAGKEADCAHKNPPIPLGPGNPDYLVYPPGYNLCLNATEANWQDVSGHYSFLLSAPPPPNGAARLVFHAVNHGSTANAPVPTLTQEGNGVRVTFDASTDPTAKPRVVMGYTVFVGWDQIPVPAVPTHLRVTLDKLEIHRSMDALDCVSTKILCAQESTRTSQQSLSVPPGTGQWNLYWDVNGIWGQWGRSDADPAAKGELDVVDGSVLAGTQAVDLYVPPGKGWRFFVHGRECDLGLLGPTGLRIGDMADCPNNQDIATDNDVPGLILDQYASAQLSLGTHRSNGLTAKNDPTSTCPDVNPQGCYSLTYTVSMVNDIAGRTTNPFTPPSGGGGPLPASSFIPSGAMLLGLLLALVGAGVALTALAVLRRGTTQPS